MSAGSSMIILDIDISIRGGILARRGQRRQTKMRGETPLSFLAGSS